MIETLRFHIPTSNLIAQQLMFYSQHEQLKQCICICVFLSLFLYELICPLGTIKSIFNFNHFSKTIIREMVWQNRSDSFPFDLFFFFIIILMLTPIIHVLMSAKSSSDHSERNWEPGGTRRAYTTHYTAFRKSYSATKKQVFYHHTLWPFTSMNAFYVFRRTTWSMFQLNYNT